MHLLESFFGVLKSEMYYGFENTFKNKYELKEAIIDYIKYYNEERIKLNLGGLSPVNYRKINRNKYNKKRLSFPFYSLDFSPI